MTDGTEGDVAEVGPTVSLMDTVPTDQPTNLVVPKNYYALRVVLPHADWPKLQDVVNRYSKDYIVGLHPADDECKHEHFHFAILDMTEYPKKEEAFRKYLKSKFASGGNKFYSGNFRDNGVLSAITYMKHVDDPQFKHRGSDWQKFIEMAPPWVHKARVEPGAPTKRKRESDPVLTYTNVLWQARRWRKEHNIKSTDLGVVLEHMSRVGYWQPSIDLQRRGLDRMHYDRFAYQCNNCVGKNPSWWAVRLEQYVEDFGRQL